MKVIKHIFSRYTAFLWALFKPLGIWGVFLVAALDGSFIGLPVDAVVIGYVYEDRVRFLLYVLMASAGSALGSIVIYLIGYKGGEELLRKRIPPARFDKIHGMFEKHPFWSLMFPAVLPPPVPFKLFVLAAAVSEMSLPRFLTAIFLGRLMRFFLFAWLTLKFGPNFVHLVGPVFRQHYYVVITLILTGVIAWIMKQKRAKRQRNDA
ncbi:MAG: DedA family protein [Acidobacteriales bacterium]|nr:DedA family protein [Terriglobales bacterium]